MVNYNNQGSFQSQKKPMPSYWNFQTEEIQIQLKTNHISMIAKIVFLVNLVSIICF